MAISKEREDELKRIQNLAIDNAIQEMDAAAACDIGEKNGRGDRSWLTGSAAKSLAVAVRLEQFMILVNRDGGEQDPEEDESAHKATERMLKNARAEVSKIMQRVGVGKAD